MIYNADIKILSNSLIQIPKHWDGKECILELKEHDYNWRQMEWWGFYFEWKVRQILSGKFQMPGDKINNTTFDLKGKINWDLKASATNSDINLVILNDCQAMNNSINALGYHGEIIALCEVTYNDRDRSFQKWVDELKGGKSKYEKEREKRTKVSRLRKTAVDIDRIALIVLQESDLDKLKIMRQGRNSNGKNRPEKYMIDLEDINEFNHFIIDL